MEIPTPIESIPRPSIGGKAHIADRQETRRCGAASTKMSLMPSRMLSSKTSKTINKASSIRTCDQLERTRLLLEMLKSKGVTVLIVHAEVFGLARCTTIVKRHVTGELADFARQPAFPVVDATHVVPNEFGGGPIIIPIGRTYRTGPSSLGSIPVRGRSSRAHLGATARRAAQSDREAQPIHETPPAATGTAASVHHRRLLAIHAI